jgi:hypothetical protein
VGGGSKLTWQAFSELAYVRRWGDIELGYRTLELSQGAENSTADLRLNGPVIAVRFRFGD